VPRPVIFVQSKARARGAGTGGSANQMGTQSYAALSQDENVSQRPIGEPAMTPPKGSR
jgi:hypothetical protein